MTDDNLSEWVNDIHQGDAEETMQEMPASSVHCVMTSPPYFGLRDYDADGQIGLEDSVEEFIQSIVDVGEALGRVLRDDGSWWLNLGDSFGDSKNKLLVPHRVAIALQDSGWVVRNDATWYKPNPMPSSVKDRLNTTTEQVFHLTPEPDYWYDLDAIREPYSESMKRRAHYQSKHGGAEDDGWGGGTHHNGGLLDDSKTYADTMHPSGKNPGDVFEVTTKPFPEAHFAVYPPELCETPIKASCPPTVCAVCGTGYERDVERETVYDHETTAETGVSSDRNDTNGGNSHDVRNGVFSQAEFNGWEQACDCDTDETEPGIVLDPFAGAGTTCRVAKDHGRWFIGIDLNEEYVAMAQKRVGIDVDEPEHLLDDYGPGLDAFADGGGR